MIEKCLLPGDSLQVDWHNSDRLCVSLIIFHTAHRGEPHIKNSTVEKGEQVHYDSFNLDLDLNLIYVMQCSRWTGT